MTDMPSRPFISLIVYNQPEQPKIQANGDLKAVQQRPCQQTHHQLRRRPTPGEKRGIRSLFSAKKADFPLHGERSEIDDISGARACHRSPEPAKNASNRGDGRIDAQSSISEKAKPQPNEAIAHDLHQ